MKDGSVHVFVGPTAYLANVPVDARVTFHPPVGRGDVDLLVETRAAATLVIVDGVFRDRLAVSHRELLRALARGWQVWGLASMGALRAVELASYGMRGSGRVFERALADAHFRDDEVTLLHAPAPRFQPITEALVNLRELITALVAEHLLPESRARLLEDELARSWFGARSLQRVTEAVVEHAGAGLERLDSLLDARAWDVKARDYRTFMQSVAARNH